MNDEQYWQAVQRRDREADGTFVYAVRSTGIYCRPICPARRPSRAQVVFFARPEEAERGGFRACLRCHPRESVMPSGQPQWVQEACRYIEAHADETLTLNALSAQVNISVYHLQRTFKRALGVTPRQYAEAQRLARLKSRLKEGDTVTSAMYEVGYGSSSRLYERASSQLGMTPRKFRQGGEGVSIHYTIVDCTLGRLMVAATQKGICFVSLGDGDDELLAELRRDYALADIRHDPARLGPWVRAIVGFLSGQETKLDLPLDVRATAFQWRVWRELQAIPYGSTRSYRDIAAALGTPKAIRAVGRACATNPVSLVIPCHRAVRADGGLAGYRWGIARKQKLLDRERKVKSGAQVP
jgi:AraC family transcriptional regulator of adaptative response/methylated-DNA-[protein]-cysteine methyltransferase